MDKDLKKLNRQLFWAVGWGATIRFLVSWVIVGMVLSVMMK